MPAIMVLLLGTSMLMFSDIPLISQRLDMAEVGAKIFVFTISLLDTTIQDSGMKERGNILTPLCYLSPVIKKMEN